MLIDDMRTGMGLLVIIFNDGERIEFEKNDYFHTNIGFIKSNLAENGIELGIKYSENAETDSSN